VCIYQVNKCLILNLFIFDYIHFFVRFATIVCDSFISHNLSEKKRKDKKQMTKHNCYICNSTISEEWLEVSEGVNNTGECYECFKKEQRGREWERSQTNDLLGRED
jgi:hypothetical protein